MTNEQLLEALTIGRDCAAELADNYHQAMKGYRQYRHDAMDADVATIDAAIAALATQPQAPQGGWLLIEDVPQSEDRFLVISRSGRITIDTGHFMHNMMHAAKVDGDECFYTHFMPLPAAPTKTPEVLE